MTAPTIADLLEGVEADAWPAVGRVFNVTTIERVFGPVLAELCDVRKQLNSALNALNIAYEQNAALRRSCADLQASKDDYWRNGVAQGRAQRVPEGWKLAPIEPTPKMEAAGQAEINRLSNDGVDRYWQDIYGAGYKAMLSATPQPPMAEQAELVKECPEFLFMGAHACRNRHQCFEPCGELGKSKEHARAVPEQAEPSINDELLAALKRCNSLLKECGGNQSHLNYFAELAQRAEAATKVAGEIERFNCTTGGMEPDPKGEYVEYSSIIFAGAEASQSPVIEPSITESDVQDTDEAEHRVFMDVLGITQKASGGK